MGPLTTNRQASTVSNSAKRAEVNQTFNIHGDFLTKFTFHSEVRALDGLTQPSNFDIGQLEHASARLNLSLS